uniref:U1-lycotoxin-Ls1a n=1 Tax=Lycosa singoriensis TaxID=434756 RepID=LYC34_LYCSI|nr:RecName: Full=U1-lycotoxin-Ls1a; Short=U1-LCTX-Ls1a; AltName: Full=Peptide 2034 [Lycosa singoriensis]
AGIGKIGDFIKKAIAKYKN